MSVASLRQDQVLIKQMNNEHKTLRISLNGFNELADHSLGGFLNINGKGAISRTSFEQCRSWQLADYQAFRKARGSPKQSLRRLNWAAEKRRRVMI
jgi:hypothetical protein